MRLLVVVVFALLTLTGRPYAEQPRTWNEILRAARGQIVYWNAWGGDDRNNAYIAWVAAEVERRYGVSVRHVKLADTAEAVTRVVAERAAGRDANGTVDLIWINGPNLASMKEHDLLFGPITSALPNFALVDTVGKPSTVVDFTLPVDGMASPWLMAQVVYVYDSRRSDLAGLPRSAGAMLAWAKANPGRLTHPVASNFLGATFLKQALYELAFDPSVLQREATDALFAPESKRLFAWYEELRPHLWRGGRDFPESGPAMRQLLADGEIDLMISFNPAEAALGIANGLLPDTARVMTPARGSIGNTSFVAIPYNASHKEGAMVVANFLLEPEAQARAQDPRVIGLLTVLDLERLAPSDRARFEIPPQLGMPPPATLGQPLPEPHPSWATRLVAEWQKRTAR